MQTLSDNLHAELEKLIAKYRTADGGLVPLLQEAQDLVGYLPREVLEKIAQGLDLSLAKVVGVATFYSQFHLHPRGKNIIRVCQGTACHVRGGLAVLEKFEEKLGIGRGGTTKDLQFTIESVACLGACGLAPVVMVNDDTHGKMSPEKIPELLASYKGDKPHEQ
jgi:NADH-quinone oxidoreductase E subunit